MRARAPIQPQAAESTNIMIRQSCHQRGLRELSKMAMGTAVTLVDRRRRFDNSLFLLAHMRCGSTALSNVLCSRPDISGYGEAHIRYDSVRALGRLVVNQQLRGAYVHKAPVLFDKILHTRHDGTAPDEFFRARSIFLIREPMPTIASIRRLFVELKRDEYKTDAACATYYSERLKALEIMWHRFPANNCVALLHSDFIDDPELALTQISNALSIDPPLVNSYDDISASRAGGAGDPLVSGTTSRIERRAKSISKTSQQPDLDLSDEEIDHLQSLYRRVATTFGLHSPEENPSAL